MSHSKAKHHLEHPAKAAAIARGRAAVRERHTVDRRLPAMLACAGAPAEESG